MESEEGEEEEERTWDDECYVCKEASGSVMCCEGCERVCHIECTKSKQPVKGDWYCPKCEKKKK